MIRLFQSVLQTLAVFGLLACAGPKKASSKGKPQALPSAAEGASAAAATVSPAATGAPPPAGNPPAGGADSPSQDPDAAARDAYWKLAMQRYKPPASGAQPTNATPDLPDRTDTVTPEVSTSTPPVPQPTPKTAVTAQELNAADIPYATWAPGKRGVVKSPFDPNGRLIDVRDFNAGQMSQCPYTGKIFRVPPLK